MPLMYEEQMQEPQQGQGQVTPAKRCREGDACVSCAIPVKKIVGKGRRPDYYKKGYCSAECYKNSEDCTAKQCQSCLKSIGKRGPGRPRFGYNPLLCEECNAQ